MALPHVEAVTIHCAGHLTVLRVGPPGESVVDTLIGLGQMQGAAMGGFRTTSDVDVGPYGGPIDFGGAP